MEVTWPIPIPPTPMTARVRTSLGGVNSGPPSTYRGTILTVAKEAMEVLRKLRRVNLWRLFINGGYYQTNGFPPIQISDAQHSSSLSMQEGVEGQANSVASTLVALA